MHVPNKNSNIQGRSPNVVYNKELLFPLREVPILKREATFFLFTFDVRNFFSVLATPLHTHTHTKSLY